jgi:hypothetical protein
MMLKMLSQIWARQICTDLTRTAMQKILLLLFVSCGTFPLGAFAQDKNKEASPTDVKKKTAGDAQMIGFSCEARGEGDDHIWRYTFEIDRKTSKGVQRGETFGGDSYSLDIEVVFTPERMQIKKLGAHEFTGFVDRSTLAFSFGGADGKCKMVPVKIKATKF